MRIVESKKLRASKAGLTTSLILGKYRHRYYTLVNKLDEAVDASIMNSYLAQAMRNLRMHLVRIRRLAADDTDRLVTAATEHAAIAEAIAAAEPRLAEAATMLHLHRSLSHIKATHTPHS